MAKSIEQIADEVSESLGIKRGWHAQFARRVVEAWCAEAEPVAWDHPREGLSYEKPSTGIITPLYLSPAGPEVAEMREKLSAVTVERDQFAERRCEICGYAEHHREHTGCLRTQLAAAQAREAKLREALGQILYFGDAASSSIAREVLTKTLATDTSAVTPWPMEQQPDGTVTPVSPEDMGIDTSVIPVSQEPVAWRHPMGPTFSTPQPLTALIDAARQALEALEMPCDRWNKEQYLKVSAASTNLRNALEPWK